MSLKCGYTAKRDPLSRKARPNPRYSHCGRRVDTGLSRSLSVVSDCSVARLREEVFRRIRPAAFVRFVAQREGLPCPAKRDDSSPAESVSHGYATPEKKKRPCSAPCSRSPAKSYSASSTPVKGSPPSKGYRKQAVPTSPARTPAKDFQSPEKVTYGYVLSPAGASDGSAWSFGGSDHSSMGSAACAVILDVRTAEEFMQSHVRGALSHPTAWLCQDRQVLALQRAKADPHARVIVYGHDDRDGAVAAQLLAQKGWENLWVLTGGFQKLLEEPCGLSAVVGAAPLQNRVTDKPSKATNAVTLLNWGQSGARLHGAGSPSAQSIQFLRREMRCSTWSTNE